MILSWNEVHADTTNQDSADHREKQFGRGGTSTHASIGNRENKHTGADARDNV